ncbi:MAG: hypothetical protein WCA38_08780 [Candidatus Acidiferrales bacterium]
MKSRPARNRQLGKGTLKSLLILLITLVVIYAAVKIAPAYMNNYQLQDSMTSEARFATSTYPKKTPDDIRDDLYRKMQELGVPARKEDIQVNMQDQFVGISLDYAVPVDLSIYQFTLQFHPHADSHSI